MVARKIKALLAMMLIYKLILSNLSTMSLCNEYEEEFE